MLCHLVRFLAAPNDGVLTVKSDFFFFFRVKDRDHSELIGPAGLCKAGKTAVVPKLV